MERAAALKVSTLLRVNPTPVAVRLTAAPPIDDERGLTVRSTGDTVNGVALEGAAPGVATVSGNVPERARSWEVIAACSWVELTYVVPSGAPAQFTTELGPKPAPVTITRKYAPPASTGLGESEAMAGAPRVELMVKVAVLDAPPYWLTSWMLAAPAAAIRLPGTDAVTVVSAGCVVASGEPFHCTTHTAGQLAPVTVSVKAAEPAVAAVGEIVAIAGVAPMGNDCGNERPVPVESLTTTVAAPVVRSAVAGIAAVSVVELTYIVARAAALK